MIDISIDYDRLFYTLGYNPILIYLFFLKFSSLAIGNFFQLVPLSSWHICDVVVCLSTLFKLLFIIWHQKMLQDSFCYISCPSPRVISSPISGSPSSLLLENGVSETKIWILGVLFATGLSLLLGPQMMWAERYMYMHTQLCYILVNTSACVYLYLN